METSTTSVLVTGGKGLLGGLVVERLLETRIEARVLSRSISRSGAADSSGMVQGDLATGEGLREAVRGVSTVVHCATNPYRKTRQTDVCGTERLLKAARDAGVSHFVFVSIVGVDRNPHYPYFRLKLEAERVVERSGVPWTILRATQFHDFILKMLKLSDRLPVTVVPKGFRLQPIEAREVADRLAELALSSPEGRVPNIGGPQVLDSSELACDYLAAIGRPRRRLLGLPLPRKVARPWREGAQLCSENRYGEVAWGEFLHQRYLTDSVRRVQQESRSATDAQMRSRPHQ
jgi:uncharacterized protein YbjT (DUF2867 family)